MASFGRLGVFLLGGLLALGVGGAALGGEALQPPGSSSAASATLPAANATVSDYVSYALSVNPGIKAARSRWAAARERVPQAGSLPDPKFTYGSYLRAVETRVGPQRQSFALSQTFPWFGKLSLRSEMADRAALAEEARYEGARRSLVRQVRETYAECYYLGRSIGVTEAHRRLLSELEEVARTRYAAQSASYGHVIQVQVELSRLEDRLATLKDMRAPLVARMNSLLDRPPQDPIPWPSVLPEARSLPAEKALEAELKDANPELEGLRFLEAKEAAALELARKEGRPDFSVGVMLIDTGDARMPGTPDSGKDPVIATVSVNLPVWWGKYHAAEREAVARKAAVSDSRDATLRQLSAELQKALFQVRDADRKIALYRGDLIPKARQSLEVARSAYMGGESDFMNLIDTERTLLDFELSLERALTDRFEGMAAVKALVGDDTVASPGPQGPETKGVKDHEG